MTADIAVVAAWRTAIDRDVAVIGDHDGVIEHNI